VRAENPNSSNSPGRIGRPVASQVTVSTTSVTGSPNTSMGSSSVFIVMERFHPSLGWKLTFVTLSGRSTSTLTVPASSRSLGTRTTNRKNSPVGASVGWIVTCASAEVAKATSASTVTATVPVFRIRPPICSQ
jgi:hypothetical protein